MPSAGLKLGPAVLAASLRLSLGQGILGGGLEFRCEAIRIHNQLTSD